MRTWFGRFGLGTMILLGALQTAMPSAFAQGMAKPVRVANGTTLDILTVPDVRTFEYFLPNKYGIKGEIEYVPGAVRAIQAVLTGASDVGIATLAAVTARGRAFYGRRWPQL